MTKVILFIYVIQGGIIEGPVFENMDQCMLARAEIVVQSDRYPVRAICVPGNRVRT
jgi:hypothetical protein